MCNETIFQASPEFHVTNILNLKPLIVSEGNQVIEKFSEIAKRRLQSLNQEGLGPLMLRSHISPPEKPLKELIGKKSIGIDIGGTNLRMSIGEVDNNGHMKPAGNIKSKEIPIRYDSLDNFFEMLLINGLEKLLKENPDVPLACIFSFPGTGQLSSNGIDIAMASDDMPKGWHIGGAKGKNLGEELNKYLQRKDEEIKRKKIKLDRRLYGQRKYFIANDTVALIQNQTDDFGVVCGSGYNWSMVIENNKLGESQGESGKTIINTEAGQAAVVSKIPIITDKLLEIIAKEENVPVDQIPLRDEYQVSGKYLGRTLGLIVENLRDEYKGHNLFNSVNNTVFSKSFVVSHILEAQKAEEAGIDYDWSKIKKDFQSKQDFSEKEIRLLINIASALRDRSAEIVAHHLIALWKTGCPEKKKLIIPSDGPIIQNMPGWKNKFNWEIKSLSNWGLEIEIRETPYQGKMRDFRGIFDVMSQAIEYFNRN